MDIHKLQFIIIVSAEILLLVMWVLMGEANMWGGVK